MDQGGSTRFYASTSPAAAPRPTGRRRRLRGLVAVVCWVYLVAVLGAWLVLGWADEWWPATLLMFAPRWLLAVPLAALVPAAFLFRPRSLGLLLIAALVVAVPVLGFCAPWRQVIHPAPPGTPFRVLTCNMHYAHGDPGALDNLVAATNPDVVAVQEWPGSAHSALRTAPGWYTHPGSRLFLASRHPIRGAVKLGRNSMGTEGSVTRYELETPLGVVHVFNLHLASAREGLYAVTHDRGGGAAGVRANSALRQEQSECLAGWAAEVRGPLLLVGDFNTPPQSTLFAQDWGDYRDAFASAGLGWGFTFFGGRTMVRIDHVLMGRGWYCRHCQVGPDVGSQHRPVLADLIWPDAEPVEE